MSSVSIKDVARIAGVSIATVSRCVNNPERVKAKTRKIVQDTIKQTGYSPNTLAQSFRRGKTQVIMVVLPSVGDPFFTGVIHGIRKIATENSYSLLINETQFNTMTEDEIGAMVVSRQADGIVLLASMSPFGTELLSERNNRALPIVVGCETISADLDSYPSVHIDNVAAATEAPGHLITLGHKKIAFMYGQPDSLLTRDRESGYRATMKKADLEVVEGWVVSGNLSIEGAAEATNYLLDHEDVPTAIFCANDEMAIGCMHAIQKAGLNVPADISVIGFDDTRYAAVTKPGLTTIRQPAKEIGMRVMQRLLHEIEHGRSAMVEPELLPHQLIVRESTAKPERSG